MDNLRGVRLFVALRLPHEVLSGIDRTLVGLRAENHGVRWVQPENYHLTLAFLGEMPPERLKELKLALDRVEAPPLALCVGGPGVFPDPGHPTVLWFGLEGRVAELHGAVRLQLEQAGFLLDKKPFTSHITVGRQRNPRSLRAWPPPIVQAEFRASEFVLMGSHLRPGEPPRYEVLHVRELIGEK